MDSSLNRTCKFYVKRKRRYCKMLVKSNQQYCGQHLVEVDASQDSSRHKRIPCPLDPRHSCFEHRLELHLAVCNAREVSDIPYKRKNINTNTDDAEEPPKTPLSQLSDQKMLEFISKIEMAHKVHVGDIEENILHYEEVEKEIAAPGCGMSALRHQSQISSLLGHIQRSGFLNTSDLRTCFVEFGAGRGKLTNWLAETVTDTHKCMFVLVDRDAQRYKCDAKLKHNEELTLQRLRVDIQHLDLNCVPSIENYDRVIGVGKHLCGGATDLALHCLSRYQVSKVSGIVLALCCHHRCTWSTYTGRRYLQDIGFSPEDFYTLTSFTSWATCNAQDAAEVKKQKLQGVDPTSDSSQKVDLQNENSSELEKSKELTSSKDKPGELTSNGKSEFTDEKTQIENRYVRLRLSIEYREEVGRKAKQILDYGRVEYLRSKGLECRLISYIPKEVTLENIALIATHKGPSL